MDQLRYELLTVYRRGTFAWYCIYDNTRERIVQSTQQENFAKAKRQVESMNIREAGKRAGETPT